MTKCHQWNGFKRHFIWKYEMNYFQWLWALECEAEVISPVATTQSSSTTTKSTSTTSTTTSTTTPQEQMSYRFVIPDEKYNFIKDNFRIHQIGNIPNNTIEVSKLCNPNFITEYSEISCGEIFRQGQCEFNLMEHLREARQYWRRYGKTVWETRLNCPECGCGKNGAPDLNEIAEEEGWQ